MITRRGMMSISRKSLCLDWYSTGMNLGKLPYGNCMDPISRVRKVMGFRDECLST